MIGVSDEVIVHGKDTEDHDKNLTSLLEKCRTLGIKLNKDKAELRKTQISFLGHLVTKDGLQIDPEKLEAVWEMPKPQDVEGIRRFWSWDKVRSCGPLVLGSCMLSQSLITIP